MTSAARAYPNIALVKYWGKADDALVLPAASSVSLTLDQFPTTTTVAPVDAPADTLELGGEPASPKETARVSAFLDVVRAHAARGGVSLPHLAVRSVNAAPTGAGLASSASGFAALALASADAYGLHLSTRDLSRLARRGSGSATRSVIPGVALWHSGDDAASFAEPIEAPDLRMVVVQISAARKKISSREAMGLTRDTSPYYAGWVTSTEATAAEMVQACARGDLTRIGELTELSAARMHAVIASGEPPIRYLAPASFAVFDTVARLRSQGRLAYATADAGPNVVVVTGPEDADAVADALAEFGTTTVCAPGPGAALVAPEEFEAALQRWGHR